MPSSGSPTKPFSNLTPSSSSTSIPLIVTSSPPPLPNNKFRPRKNGTNVMAASNDPVDQSLQNLTSKAGPEQSLRSYHLLEALRGGDQSVILPLLTATSSSSSKSKTPAVSESGAIITSDAGTSTPLHLAVRCAKYPTVAFVLEQCPQFLNSQDAKLQTPLHLAASLNRPDVVTLLINQQEVDDMIKDSNGKTCLDVAAGSEVAGLISVSRAEFNHTYLQLFHAYINSPLAEAPPTPNGPAAALNPRSSISGPPSSNRASMSLPSPSAKPGGTPAAAPPAHSHHHGLHLPHHTSGDHSKQLPQIVSAASGHVSNVAAEKLYHWVARPRARCLDFTAKDNHTGTTVLHEAVRRKDLGIIKLVISRGGDVLVRDRKGKLPIELAKDERVKGVLRQVATSEGRALKAAANSGGVNGDGALSGAPPSYRGWLNKWTNMARGYKSRWFVLDKGVLSYYRSQEEEGKVSRGSINMSVARVLPPGTDGLKFEVSNKLNKSFPSFWLKGAHPVEVMRWVEVLRQNIEIAQADQYSISRSQSIVSLPPTLSRRTSAFGTTSATTHHTSSRGSPTEDSDRDGSLLEDDETFNGDFDQIPHLDDFDLLANGTKTQLELTQQLLDSLVIVGSTKFEETSSPVLGSGRPPSIRSVASSRQADVKEALKGSLGSLGTMLNEYIAAVGERERYYAHRYEKEIEAKRLWEESLKEVAEQHKNLEDELLKVGRDNTRRRRALQEVKANLAGSPTLSPSSIALGGGVQENGDLLHLPEDGQTALPPPLRTSTSNNTFRLSEDRSRRLTIGTSGSLSPARLSRIRSATMHTLNPSELEQLVDSAIQGEDDEGSDDEDEFYEAIESGTIPLEEIESPSVTSPVGSGGMGYFPKRSEPAELFMQKMDMEPYRGYEKLRSRLPIDSDNRPPVSLWAILKGSIGKDLTKISFPVFFNEPTSMLQRMAEDVEFSECLDSASINEDPLKRIMFVAAFAMSNYSSTIGRIAKPFNPMLGETFEYVDPVKKYRYISEQVCHHPPISACIAQSASWEYYGEVDAKSKFLGKSFEIRPTGVAHVKLRIPEAWAPGAPPATRTPGLVQEHYSWKKVTTSVSNFLFGNPIIDHYGDMVITNHRTGDTCTLTFKPRGWRGSGACEIKGKVVDKSGREHWDIAGKWNSQLFARRVGTGNGELAPDAAIPTNQAAYLRLWKNSEKPPGMPFNLTPYAITLNDDNPDIKTWLPPTDCRLRPDQHAFESGDFERANNLKTELEEHQRETRRKRERGEAKEHVARWFVRKRDADTGETVWDPVTVEDGSLEYWEERIRVGTAKKKGEKTVWKDVEPIFADF